MGIKQRLIDFSRGDGLCRFWRLYFWRERTKSGLLRSILTFLCARSANAHGGYVGAGAHFADIPSLPHGLHGIFISRAACIGRGCRIYQNVTLGEVNGSAPQIGDDVLIGAGAVLVGGITVGDGAKIGAGATVFADVPAGATVVCVPPRVIVSPRGIRERKQA